ncbi:2OG-Fe(II) oxygenase [Ideonella azotifigens]|uniref:2OG-Fe(II) oxygenase n=2 Tax=Ideonella azotifigens TaxID=513160 RepID=A0ABP3V7B1_9BURK|nr:2OG-Fe(II) oxygenase [Ideonella azotifigens]MCD2341274.1 2OG-Fe(II) oxygenase [Ideonella azotifigens]
MNVQQTITPELRAWIVAQAQAGCQPADVLNAMRASGWDEQVAMTALEDTLEAHLGRPAVEALQQGISPGAVAAQLAQPQRLPEPALEAGATTLQLPDREVQVLMQMALPRVVVLGGFLSHEECDALVALANPRLSRSETVVNATGGSEVNSARTSDGMFFGRGEHALCARIEQRIADLLRWPVINGEGLQVLRYRPGAQYLPHHDYFDPAQPGAPTILSRGGQRLGTLLMYLNTPERGGATTFPDVGLEVAPIKGNAVFFSYSRPSPTTRTLHGGAPVLAGEKWVATKWLREGEFH